MAPTAPGQKRRLRGRGMVSVQGTQLGTAACSRLPRPSCPCAHSHLGIKLGFWNRLRDATPSHLEPYARPTTWVLGPGRTCSSRQPLGTLQAGPNRPTVCGQSPAAIPAQACGLCCLSTAIWSLGHSFIQKQDCEPTKERHRQTNIQKLSKACQRAQGIQTSLSLGKEAREGQEVGPSLCGQEALGRTE